MDIFYHSLLCGPFSSGEMNGVRISPCGTYDKKALDLDLEGLVTLEWLNNVNEKTQLSMCVWGGSWVQRGAGGFLPSLVSAVVRL